MDKSSRNFCKETASFLKTLATLGVNVESSSTSSSLKVSSVSKSIFSENPFPLLEGPRSLGHYPLTKEEIEKGSFLDTLIKDEKSLPFKDMSEREMIKIATNFLGGGMFTGGKEFLEYDGLNYKHNFETWEWLFADIIKNSKNQETPAFATVKDIEQKIKQLKEYAEDLKRLEDLEESKQNPLLIEETAQKYVKKIHDLKPGQSVFLTGGWGNLDGGHAVIYQFTRRADKLLDISIITSTGYQLAEGATKGGKRRIDPVILYEKVPEEFIFFNEGKTYVNENAYQKRKYFSTAFIQSLIELQVLRTWDSNRHTEEEDVLEVFDFLSDYKAPYKKEKKRRLITGQRGGTCVPSSTKQAIREIANDDDLYKQMMIHCDLRLMVATYQKLKAILSEDSKDGDLTRRLLRHIATKLSNSIAKLIKESGSLIEEQFAEQAIATCCDLIRKLDLIDEDIKKMRAHKPLFCNIDKLDTNHQRGERENKVRRKICSPEGLGEIEGKPLPTDFVKIDSYEQFHQVVEKFSLKEDQTSKAFGIEIQHIIDQLPLPELAKERLVEEIDPLKGIEPLEEKLWVEKIVDPFWSKIPDEQLDSYLADLETLLNLYLNSLRETKNVRPRDLIKKSFYFPKIQASVLTIYTLTHYLSLRMELYIDKQLGKKSIAGRLSCHQAVNFPELTTEDMFEGQIFLGTSDYKKIHQAFEYFQSFNKQAKKRPVFTEEGHETVFQWKTNINPSTGEFWKELSALDDKLYKKACEIGNLKWKHWTEEEIETEYKEFKERQENEQKQFSWLFCPLERRVNLAESTKICMVLHASADERVKDCTQAIILQKEKTKDKNARGIPRYAMNSGPCNVLCETYEGKTGKYNYNYLNIFRRIIRHTMSTVIDGIVAGDFEVKAERESINCIKGKMKGSSYTCNTLPSQATFPQKSVRGISEEHYHLLTQHPRFRRTSSYWRSIVAEGETIDERSPPIFDPNTNFKKKCPVKLSPLLKKILRTLPEWKLAPHQIIKILENHFEDLKDLSTQRLLLRILFRSPALKNRNDKLEEIHLGTGELIIYDEMLVKAFDDFIQKGLFYYKEQNENSKLEGAKFIFSLAFTLSTYLKDGHQKEALKKFNLIGKIDEWIEKEKKTKNKSALHFYRVLFYSVLPDDELKPSDWSSLYQSWIVYRFHQYGDWEIPMELEWAENFILNHTGKTVIPTILQEELTRNTLCNDILSALKLNSDNLIWSKSSIGNSIFEGKINGVGATIRTIDLAAGAVYSENNHKYGHDDKERPWESNDTFKKLFGLNPKFEYLREGNTYTFTHPTMGEMRVVRNESNRLIYWAIQRKFPQNDQWYQAIDAHSLSKLDNVFDHDHVLWLSLESWDAYGFKIKGYIACLKDGIRRYAIAEDGIIVEVNGRTGLPEEKSHLIDILNDSILPKFDVSTNILTYRSREKQTLEKIRFARYVSIEGNPLQFISTRNGLAWSENREYVIPQNMPQGYLGTLDKQALYLVSTIEEKKVKVLVPFAKISQRDIGPIASGELDKWIPKDSEISAWNNYNYFVYDIVAGEIKPTTLEASLFLAYIKLSQKEYKEAFALLEKMKPTEKISPMGLNILELIAKLPLGEDHPDAKMVKFNALALSLKQEKKSSKIPELYISYSFLGKWNPLKIWETIEEADSYLQSKNKVSVFCRLSPENESIFLEGICKAGFNKAHEICKAKEISYERFRITLKPLLKRQETLDPKNIVDHDKYVAHFSGERNFTAIKFYRWQAVEHWDWKKYFEGVDEVLKIRENESEQQREKRIELFYNKHYSWLDKKENERFCPLYTRSLDKENIGKNRALFQQVTHLATWGQDCEKRDMLFRLRLWHIHSRINDPELEIMMRILCSALVLQGDMFFRVKLAKDLDSVWGGKKEVLEYLDNCITWNREFDYKVVEKYIKQFPKKKTSELPQQQPQTETISKSNDYLVKEIPKESIPMKIDLSQDHEHWKQLKSWKDLYAKSGHYSHPENSKQLSLKFEDHLLAEEEKEFSDPLINDLFKLQKDYQEGKNINENENTPLINDEDAGEISKQALECKLLIHKKIEDKTQVLLQAYANKRGLQPVHCLSEIAKIVGNAKKNGTFLDCVDVLLSLNESDFKLLNKHLTSEEMKQMAKLTLEIEDLKVVFAQLCRIVDVCENIIKIPEQSDPTRKYLCFKLDQELQAGYFIKNPEEKEIEVFPLIDKFSLTDDIKIALRVFSGQTGMILYHKQIEVINAILQLKESDSQRFCDIVIQLIMGGGKTKVIAAIILFLAAQQKDRLALFVVPPALFEVVKANLSEDFFKAFNKHLLDIDVERQDLIPSKVEEILEKIESGKKHGNPIIVKPTTLQCFQLELLARVRRLKNNYEKALLPQENISSMNRLLGTISPQQILEEGLKGIKPLVKICREFANKTNSLMDEVDLILDTLQEVNFPEGEPRPISVMENDLLREIYQRALTNDSLLVTTLEDSPSVAKFVGLHDNNQSLMDTETYKKHVVPVIANYLAENYSPLRDSLGIYHTSFKRYAGGKMHYMIQELADDNNFVLNKENLQKVFIKWKEAEELRLNHKKQTSKKTVSLTSWKDWGSFSEIQADIDFIKQLKLWSLSDDASLRETADLISLTRHVLLELTPSTLSKSGRRDYGPHPTSQTHSIIPYLAVNTPATTQFGYHLEEACYYYQWASSFSMDQKEIVELGTMLKDAAYYYVSEKGQLLEETAEYKFFNESFGITFADMENPEKLQLACNHIAKKTSTKIDLAYELVQKRVVSRPERLTSNNMALLDQLLTRWAMSGTPWNVEGFMQSLAEHYQGDLGTEGKILHKLAEKDVPIHEVNFTSVKEFLDQIYKEHPTPEKIRGIIEVGGLFKMFKDNSTVASEIMNYLQQIQEHEDELEKKGELKQRTVDPKIQGVLYFLGDTIYMWEKGAKTPTKIDNLAEKKIDPSTYFVFYDERHTTGADILQVPEAINIVTVDKDTLIRDLEQGILRLRQIFYAQNIALAVGFRTRKLFVNGGKCFEDFILNAQKAQTLRKTEDMVRFFRQQIDNIFRRRAIEAIYKAIESGDEKFAEIVSLYEPFFVTNTEGSFYSLFGRLKCRKNTENMLEEDLEDKRNAFTARLKGKDDQALESVEKDIKELKEYLKKVTCLPNECEVSHAPIGVQHQVEVQNQTEQHTQQHAEVNTEVNKEVELELQSYESIGKPELRQDEGKTKEDLLLMIDNIRKGETLYPLKGQLEKYKYVGDKRYQDVFDAPIYGTDNYFHTTKDSQYTPLPVFNKLFRPSEQILAIDTDKGMRWILLSEREAADVQQHLAELYKEDEESKKEGRASKVWLLHYDGTCVHKRKGEHKIRLGRQDVREGLIEINALCGNTQYLSKNIYDFGAWLSTHQDLKTHFLHLKTIRDPKRSRILKNALIQLGIEKSSTSTSHHKFRQRNQHKITKEGMSIAEDKVKLMKVYNVQDLHLDLVPLLGIDWSKRESCELTKKAIEKLDLKSETQADNYSRMILSALSPAQIACLTAEQVRWLPGAQIKHLTQSYQIAALTKSHDPLSNLEKSQELLIPFLDASFYEDFTHSWQIMNIPLEHMDKIKPQFYHLLSKKQVKSLSDISLLKGEQIKMVHGSLLEKVVEMFPAYLHLICQEQIQEITDPSLIQKLEDLAPEITSKFEVRWSSLLSPEQVGKINFKTQLKFLTTVEQLDQVPEDYVKDFSETQVKALPKTFASSKVKKIKNQLVQFVSFDLVPYLSIKQLNHISMLHVQYLSINQIAKLPRDFPGDFVKCIKDPNKLEKVPGSLARHFDQNQAILATKIQVEKFTLEQIRGLLSDFPMEKLHWIIEPEKIKLIPSCHACHFSSQQIPHATIVQTNEFIEKQIKALPDNFPLENVQYIVDPHKIQWIPPYLAKHFTETQVIHATDEQIKTLPENFPVDALRCIVDPQKIKIIPNSLAKHFTKTQIVYATKDQIDEFTDEQIKTLPENFPVDRVVLIDDPRKIQLMPPYLVKHFSQEQVIHATDEQIKALPENFPVDALRCIVDPQKIKIIPTCLAKHFSQQQVIHATDEQIKALPENFPVDALRCIVDPQKIKIIPTCLAKHFSQQQVIHATDEQIKVLPENFPVDALRCIVVPQKIKIIPACLAKHFSQEQVTHATDEQIQALPPNFSGDILRSILDPRKVPLIPFYLAHHMSKEQMVHATENQVKWLTNDQVNILPDNFPALKVNWITNLACLPARFIKDLADEKLRHVTNRAAINSVGFMRVQHLVWTQLRERHWFWNTVYVVGVVTLGIVSTALALLAYLTLIPFVAAYIMHTPGRPNPVFRWMNANTLRVIRLAWVTCTGRPYSVAVV